MNSNPYQVLGTHEVIMRGRKGFHDQICRHLTKATPDHISLVGPALIGKTVFLKNLEKKFAKENPHYLTSVYWDIRHKTPTLDLDFKRAVSEKVRSALMPFRADLAIELNIDKKEIGDNLDAVFSLLADENQRLLVIIDGFDHVLATASITRNLWDYMRTLAHKSSFRLVIGSQRRLQEICKTEECRSSDFWEIFYDTPIQMGPFEEEDWEDILIPFAEQEISLDSSARKELMNWTGGVPILVAALLKRLYVSLKPKQTLSKREVDEKANEMREQCADIFSELWNDCLIDEQSNLITLASSNLPKSKIPDPRRHSLQQRGYLVEQGSQLKLSCKLIGDYALKNGSGVENLRRLFGDKIRYEQNIRNFLEMRLSQLKQVDSKLRLYVERAIRDLQPEPELAVRGIRGIAERALDLVLAAELPTRTIPEEWVKVWKDAKEFKDDSPIGKEFLGLRVPNWRSGQCRLLQLMTGTQNVKPVAKLISKPTFILIDFLQSAGDFGQHIEENPMSLGFAAFVCNAAIELCVSLSEDLRPLKVRD